MERRPTFMASGMAAETSNGAAAATRAISRGVPYPTCGALSSACGAGGAEAPAAATRAPQDSQKSASG